jgi:hypothetical protein
MVDISVSGDGWHQAVIGDGLSISQVAEKVGVSRQTLHAWLARYESSGRGSHCWLALCGPVTPGVEAVPVVPGVVAFVAGAMIRRRSFQQQLLAGHLR